MLKIHIHGSLVFITSTMQQGIFLPPNAMTILIITSCLARAQELYTVKIVAYSVSTTHIHIVLVIEDPDMCREFIRHFKAESAHAINNVLGVPCRNLWNEGYDSPIVLDAGRAILALAYTYANQVKDSLVDRIEQYPVELNSFQYAEMLNEIHIPVPWIPRSCYEEIPEEKRNPEGLAREVQRLRTLCSRNSQRLVLSPAAWLDALGVYNEEERADLQKRVVQKARQLEQEAREQRIKETRSVFGMATLTRTPIGAHYIPKRRGRRTYVLGSCTRIRKRVLAKLKVLFRESRTMRELQRQGNISLLYPSGLYPASLTKLMQPLSLWDMVACVE